jgi:hypothetical protein
MSSQVKALLLVAVCIVVSVVGASTVHAQEVRTPPRDDQGRFWVYQNGKGHPALVFIPFAWMPDESGQMMTMDLECKQNPHNDGVPAREGESGPEPMCIAVKVNWQAPWWVGCAFVSGPDQPPWWGVLPLESWPTWDVRVERTH